MWGLGPRNAQGTFSVAAPVVRTALSSVLFELGFRPDAVLVDLQDPLRAPALKPRRRWFNGAGRDEIITILVLVGIFIECCERLASE